MSGDFNKPSGSSPRASFMQEIRDLFADAAKMFSGTSTTNYPTGCIRYNSTTKLLEKYNGSTWDVLDLSGITAALANTLLANGSARTATNAPGANNVVVLDSNGDYKQGSELIIQKHTTNVRSFGRRNASSQEQFTSGTYTSVAVNAYFDGTNWNRISTASPAVLQVFSTAASGGPRIYTAAAGANPITWSGPYEVWHAGNDGSGSGLDADKMDGAHWVNIASGNTGALGAGSSVYVQLRAGGAHRHYRVSCYGAARLTTEAWEANNIYNVYFVERGIGGGDYDRLFMKTRTDVGDTIYYSVDVWE